MDKNRENIKKRCALTASKIKLTAKLTGVSDRQVRRVINGDSRNEDVLSTFMFLQEGENELVKQAALLVPFN